MKQSTTTDESTVFSKSMRVMLEVTRISPCKGTQFHTLKHVSLTAGLI